MRDHIREQIEWRIRSMARKCFENGSCYLCGCQTTHLQMANKPCRKPCYPKILNKKAWNMYIKRDEVWIDGKLWSFNTKEENFILLK